MKMKLKESDLVKLINTIVLKENKSRKVLKEQDMSKIDWEYGGKHESWFQYHNTFSACRTGFTQLLKELVKFFGKEVTKEANQLIVSFKRGMIQVKDKQKEKLTNADKDTIIAYLKPQLERVGIKWTDEDEKELKATVENAKNDRRLEGELKKMRAKKRLVKTALWDLLMERGAIDWAEVSKKGWGYEKSLYRICREEYSNAKRKYKKSKGDKLAADIAHTTLTADYTKISGDNKELTQKLKAANEAITEKDILIAKLKKRISQGGGESPIIKKDKKQRR